ncbi:MAG: hypothetical protein ACLUKN_11320 [Bacilli bacterium]
MGNVHWVFFDVRKGKDGDVIELRYAQELNSDGSARYKLRANCNYREFFELSEESATI